MPCQKAFLLSCSELKMEILPYNKDKIEEYRKFQSIR
jgi:hypothetical protein